MLDALAEPQELAALAQVWVDDICAQSPTSMAGIKATLRHLDEPSAGGETAVRAAFDAAFRGADFAEGAAAFLERRPAQFH